MKLSLRGCCRKAIKIMFGFDLLKVFDWDMVKPLIFIQFKVGLFPVY